MDLLAAIAHRRAADIGWAATLAWAAALATCALGCTPDINANSYYCGPERLCPPHLACDDTTHLCNHPSRALGFVCPEGSEVGEPNDTAADAIDGGTLACGQAVLDDVMGCIADRDDSDLYRFELPGECSGADPHLAVRLRFPISLVPLTVTLLDEGGAVVAEGVLCTEFADASGRDEVCIDQPIEPGVYDLRVAPIEDAPDCDGTCHHNSYVLDVAHPLA